MSYTVITAKLSARTAVHIGSGQANGLTDALIRRDGAGQPLIPGTAIAGALRSLLTRLGPRLGTDECYALKPKLSTSEQKTPCGCGVCRLFGDINPTDPKVEQAKKAEASRLLVFNAVLTNGSSQTTIRDGVGINRITGTAARSNAVKFDLEVLPAGVTFDLRLELRNQNEQDEQLLAAAINEWEAGRVWLGGRVARGLGAFELQDIQFKQLNLNETENLLAFLHSDTPYQKAFKNNNWLLDTIKVIEPAPPPTNKNDHIAQTWFSVTATLQADGPLLTNDALTSDLTGFDHAPLLAQWGDWRNPVLTGAGLRGVIRSHAERLARTLTTRTVSSRNEFLQKCPACNPVESREDKSLASCDTLLQTGSILKIDDEATDDHLCLACRLFGSTHRGSRLFIEDASYCGPEAPKLKMLDFLAIDRFTGGGADGAKFDALALWRPAFKLRLHLENPQPWELGWLALVLRDLQSGWLSVGMGAAKGFGRVRLENQQLQMGYLHPDDLTKFGLAEAATLEPSGVYKVRPIALTDASNWLAEFRQKEFNRSEKMILKKDSYFDALKSLYPQEVSL